MTRTALLIRCEADEADRIRGEAQREHRTISGYVLYVALKAVAAGRLVPEFNHYRRSAVGSGIASARGAILVRCTVTEAEQIRAAARHRQMPINAFVLEALKGAWNSRPILPPHSPMEAPKIANQPSRTN
jgi:uncharacterized protein (DUF1778 family)